MLVFLLQHISPSVAAIQFVAFVVLIHLQNCLSKSLSGQEMTIPLKAMWNKFMRGNDNFTSANAKKKRQFKQKHR